MKDIFLSKVHTVIFALSLLYTSRLKLSLTDIEEPEDSLSPGSAMILRIVKRDTPVWYAKNDGQILLMLNRGRQIHRILKRDGKITSGEVQSKILLMDRRLDRNPKGLNNCLRSTKRSTCNNVDGKHLIMFLTHG